MSNRVELPRVIAPMLVRSSPLPAASDSRWLLEVKWDGIRAQLRVDHGRVTLRTRPGRDATSDFPELAELGAALRGRHPMWVIRGDSGASMFDARARDGRASRTAWGLRESEDELIDGE